MLWELFNKGFGWDYVCVPFAFGHEVVRLRKSRIKGIYYIKLHGYLLIHKDGKFGDRSYEAMTFNKEELNNAS